MRPLKSCIWPIKQQWMVSCWLHSFECLATMGPKIIWSWIWISKFKSWKYSKCLNVPKILQDVSHNSITSKVERAKNLVKLSNENILDAIPDFFGPIVPEFSWPQPSLSIHDLQLWSKLSAKNQRSIHKWSIGYASSFYSKPKLLLSVDFIMIFLKWLQDWCLNCLVATE